MSNCTIEFFAKNGLVAGVTAGDLITLNVTLTQFDMSTKTNKVVNETKSGLISSSRFYTKNSFSIAIVDEGTVLLPNASTIDLTTAYTEMFLRSVDNSETFTITDIDSNDVLLDVQLTGDWSRSRASSAFIDRFNYSFKCREI